MKSKTKAIASYVFQCIVLIVFCYFVYYSYDLAYGENFVYADDYFCYGTVFGIALFMTYVLLISILTSVYKYIKSKINKDKLSFADILVSK